MMLYEFLISAIPSFVLAMQPNTERVKGKFIPYVLSRSIPGALTLATGILTIYIVRQSSLGATFGFVDGTGAETQAYHAMLMLGLTFCGLVMLYRICQPFNVLRAILFMTIAFACIVVLSVPVLGNIVFKGWETVSKGFSLQDVMLIIIITQMAFPVSGTLIKVFDMINPADEETPPVQ